MNRRISIVLLALCLCTLATAHGQTEESVKGSRVFCTSGQAIGFACGDIDLLAKLSKSEMQAEALNDIWGWTDRVEGRDYALVGRSDGVAFVDVTDPVNPVYVGDML